MSIAMNGGEYELTFGNQAKTYGHASEDFPRPIIARHTPQATKCEVHRIDQGSWILSCCGVRMTI